MLHYFDAFIEDNADLTIDYKEYSYSQYGFLYLYSTAKGKKCNIYQRIYEIDNNQSYINPSFQDVFNYSWVPINNPSLGVEFKCDRASAIKVEFTNGTSMLIKEKKGKNGYFFLQAAEAINAKAIYPVCSSDSDNHCLIIKELDPEKAYLVHYDSAEGVTETSDILGGGFSEEIIHSVSSVEFNKLWEGKVTFEEIPKLQNVSAKRSLKSNDGLLTYHRIETHDENDTVEIYFTYSTNSTSIPISRIALERDPNQLMVLLGIKEYNCSLVIFNENGHVSYPRSLSVRPETTNKLCAALNLPTEYVSNIVINDAIPAPSPEPTLIENAGDNQSISSANGFKFNVLTISSIAAAAVAFVVIVVVIIVVVVRRRRKANAEISEESLKRSIQEPII